MEFRVAGGIARHRRRCEFPVWAPNFLDLTAMSDDTKSEQPAPAANGAKKEVVWGRIVIAGGTDWPNVGKKDKGGQSAVDQDAHPDLYEPHVLRPLCNVRIVSVHGSPCGSHFVAIDYHGVAWLWGRNGSSCLGLDNETTPALYCDSPRRLTAAELNAPRGTRFVHAALGRHHTLLVGSGGQVWSAGLNAHAQCGHPATKTEIKAFTPIENLPTHNGQPDRIVQASAGITFSALLTESGRVYTFGSGEHGQLGNGRTGEQLGLNRKIIFDVVEEPTPVQGLDGKQVEQIASGNQHSIALTKDGLVYTWGSGGYCRTGLGNQETAMTAKLVSAPFTGEHEETRAWKVFAGPTNSIVIDRQRMLWICGKWKLTGDGSAGATYTTFKHINDLTACKVATAASGGVTHFAVCPDDADDAPADTTMIVAWGQNASYGELGLGNDAPLSATKPAKIEPLQGVQVIAIAAGQHSTVFLAKPGNELSSLPRHPHVEAPTECIVCGKDKGEDDSPLECEKCETPYHLGCLNPPLSKVPDDEWFCEKCGASVSFPDVESTPEPERAPTPAPKESVKPVANGTAAHEEAPPAAPANGDATAAPAAEPAVAPAAEPAAAPAAEPAAAPAAAPAAPANGESNGLKRKEPDEPEAPVDGDAKKQKTE